MDGLKLLVTFDIVRRVRLSQFYFVVHEFFVCYLSRDPLSDQGVSPGAEVGSGLKTVALHLCPNLGGSFNRCLRRVCAGSVALSVPVPRRLTDPKSGKEFRQPVDSSLCVLVFDQKPVVIIVVLTYSTPARTASSGNAETPPPVFTITITIPRQVVERVVLIMGEF